MLRGASTSTSPPTTEDGHLPSLVSARSCIIILDTVVAAAGLDPLQKKNQHLVKTTRNHSPPPPVHQRALWRGSSSCFYIFMDGFSPTNLLAVLFFSTTTNTTTMSSSTPAHTATAPYITGPCSFRRRFSHESPV